MRTIELKQEDESFLLDGVNHPKNSLRIMKDPQIPFTAAFIDGEPLTDIEIWKGNIFVAKIPGDSPLTRAVYDFIHSGSLPEFEPLPAMNPAINLSRIQERMTELKRQMHEEDWGAFRGLLSIWNLNRTDMSTLIRKLYEDEALAIEMIQNVREPTIRDNIHRELDRVIFNYLASFRAVIESSRNLISNYKDSNLSTKYEEFRAAFMTPENKFVDKLRNYFLHYDLPVSGQQFSFPEDGIKFGYSILADPKALLRYDGWEKSTKIFLETQDNEFDLGRILLTHQERAGDQWFWLLEQFQVLHQVEIFHYDQSVNEFNWVLSGGHKSQLPIRFA